MIKPDVMSLIFALKLYFQFAYNCYAFSEVVKTPIVYFAKRLSLWRLRVREIDEVSLLCLHFFSQFVCEKGNTLKGSK